MPNHSKVLTGSAVTSTSQATTGTIKNETGKDAVITLIEALVYPTMETVVNAGGLVEFTNGSVDIVPCNYYVGGVTGVLTGAAKLKPEMIKCHLPFPKDSLITVKYTPQDDQSQKLTIIVHFDTDGNYDESKHTWIDAAIGSALTQATIAVDHVTYDVPAAKGGTLRIIRTHCFGTLETIVNSGGLITAKNISADPTWEPLEFHIIGLTALGCGGGVIEPYIKPVLLALPSVSKIQINYTPQDNQSQLLAMTFIWTRG